MYFFWKIFDQINFKINRAWWRHQLVNNSSKVFLVEIFFPNQLQIIQNVKKRSLVKIQSGGWSGLLNGWQNRQLVFFTFWIIWSDKNLKKTVASQIWSTRWSNQSAKPTTIFFMFQPKFFTKLNIWQSSNDVIMCF